jgi:uncharacterized membrane protein
VFFPSGLIVLLIFYVIAAASSLVCFLLLWFSNLAEVTAIIKALVITALNHLLLHYLILVESDYYCY